MGVRIAPEHRESVISADRFIMQVTSAESNAASVLSYLGLPVKVLTAFVQGSPISQIIKQNLSSRNISYDGKDFPQGGPWGLRHQFNITDSGYGVRGPRVFNDRAGEVGRMLNVRDFDLDGLFVKDGAGILHISGLIAALSRETGEFCIELAERAKANGTVISFDLNYRASFWEGREKELSDVFNRIASISDILIGNEEDFQLALGAIGPGTDHTDITAKLDSFKDMIDRAAVIYPNASVFATTLRQAISANTHMWGAVVFADGEWLQAVPREISILDRIGGGDGFVGGMLYAILRGWEIEKWIRFGWACGALATTSLTDYIQPLDEEQIWDIWEGNARVKR